MQSSDEHVFRQRGHRVRELRHWGQQRDDRLFRRKLKRAQEAGLPVGIELEQIQNQPEAVSRSVGDFLHVLIEAGYPLPLAEKLASALDFDAMVGTGAFVSLDAPFVDGSSGHESS